MRDVLSVAIMHTSSSSSLPAHVPLAIPLRSPPSFPPTLSRICFHGPRSAFPAQGRWALQWLEGGVEEAVDVGREGGKGGDGGEGRKEVEA